MSGGHELVHEWLASSRSLARTQQWGPGLWAHCSGLTGAKAQHRLLIACVKPNFSSLLFIGSVKGHIWLSLNSVQSDSHTAPHSYAMEEEEEEGGRDTEAPVVWYWIRPNMVEWAEKTKWHDWHRKDGGQWLRWYEGVGVGWLTCFFTQEESFELFYQMYIFIYIYAFRWLISWESGKLGV